MALSQSRMLSKITAIIIICLYASAPKAASEDEYAELIAEGNQSDLRAMLMLEDDLEAKALQRLLGYAASQNNLPAIEALINAGAKIDGQLDGGWTAMGIALISGNEELAVELLNLGAAPRIANDDGITPADVATSLSMTSFIEAVSAARPVVMPPAPETSPDERLLSAVLAGDVESLGIALADGAGADATDQRRWPLVVISAVNGDLASLQELIDAGANLEVSSPTGVTVLNAAVMSEATDLLEGALDAGMDPDFTGSGSIARPLILAITQGNEDAIELLVEKGASLDKMEGERLSPRDMIVIAGMASGGFLDSTERMLAAYINGSTDFSELEINKFNTLDLTISVFEDNSTLDIVLAKYSNYPEEFRARAERLFNSILYRSTGGSARELLIYVEQADLIDSYISYISNVESFTEGVRLRLLGVSSQSEFSHKLYQMIDNGECSSANRYLESIYRINSGYGELGSSRIASLLNFQNVSSAPNFVWLAYLKCQRREFHDLIGSAFAFLQNRRSLIERALKLVKFTQDGVHLWGAAFVQGDFETALSVPMPTFALPKTEVAQLPFLFQSFLRQYGYYAGKIDGKWGPGSRDAALEYCNDRASFFRNAVLEGMLQKSGTLKGNVTYDFYGADRISPMGAVKVHYPNQSMIEPIVGNRISHIYFGYQVPDKPYLNPGEYSTARSFYKAAKGKKSCTIVFDGMLYLNFGEKTSPNGLELHRRQGNELEKIWPI